jgi:hypothetical protein
VARAVADDVDVGRPGAKALVVRLGAPEADKGRRLGELLADTMRAWAPERCVRRGRGRLGAVGGGGTV